MNSLCWLLFFTFTFFCQRWFFCNFVELSQLAFVRAGSAVVSSQEEMTGEVYFWWWDVGGIFHMEISRVQECTLQTVLGSSACVTLQPGSSQLCCRTVWAHTRCPLGKISHLSLNHSLLHKAEWHYCFLRSGYMFRVNIYQMKCRIKLRGSWQFSVILS